jgi:GntR family transcriptional repressor for pyruvate dehydrogenase complex
MPPHPPLPSSPRPASSLVLRYLLDELQKGHLIPGDRLPSERELALRLKVSRTSVREALRFLEARGLIEIRHGEETKIRPLDAQLLIHPLLSLLEVRGALTQHLFELRTILEPELAAGAALRMCPEELAELREVLERQEARTQAGEFPLEEDEEFHRKIAAGFHNPIAQEVYGLIHSYLRMSREQGQLSSTRAQGALEAHHQIFKALQARDPERARQAMRDHLEEVAHMLFKEAE